MITPIICCVGDPMNKSALSSSSQMGLITQGRKNGCSPSNVKLKKGDANTGKWMEPVYPDGIALKRLPVTSCHPDSQSCPCFHFFPKPRSSGLSQSNPHIRFKLAKPGFYCTQLRILPDIKRDSELGLELLGSVDTRIVHLPGCIHI